MSADVTTPQPQPSPAPRRAARPAAPPAAPRPRDGVAAAVCVVDAGPPWWSALPGRLWMLVQALVLPVRVIAWALDAAVAATVLGIVGVAWAWWTHRITDEQVAQVLTELGARGLAILGKSGVL